MITKPSILSLALCALLALTLPARSSNLSNALVKASETGKLESVKHLVAVGADVNTTHGYPLYVACEKGHAKVVKFLIAEGAQFLKKDGPPTLFTSIYRSFSGLFTYTFYRTNLCIACKNGHLDVVKVLLRADADPYACGDFGDTPLKIACKKGHLSIIKALFNAGADPFVLSLNANDRHNLVRAIVPLPYEPYFSKMIHHKSTWRPDDLVMALLQKKPISGFSKEDLMFLPVLRRALEIFKDHKIHSRIHITQQLKDQLNKLELKLDPSDNALAQDTVYFYKNLKQVAKCQRANKRFKDLKISFGGNASNYNSEDWVQIKPSDYDSDSVEKNNCSIN